MSCVALVGRLPSAVPGAVTQKGERVDANKGFAGSTWHRLTVSNHRVGSVVMDYEGVRRLDRDRWTRRRGGFMAGQDEKGDEYVLL